VRIAGNYNFAAPREEVWAAMNDPEVLARVLPGCQKLEQVGEHEFETTLNIRLQAVQGTYSGRVCIEDLQPPAHYRLTIDGKGSNGFLKGEGSVDLREETTVLTIMDYGGEAQVGGTIASVGQRLLDGAAKTLINQSLKALAAQIEARTRPADTEVEVEAGAETEDSHAASAEPADSMPPSAPVQVATPGPEAASSPVAPTPSGSPVSPPPPAQAGAHPTPDWRTISVPEAERLSVGRLVRGILADFLEARPWLFWVVAAFVIGLMFGRKSSTKNT